MIRALRCFKCHEDTAVLTYEENRIYKVSCPCGCEYTFEHSSQTAAYDYHLKMVELYAEIDRNAALKAENATLRAQLAASQQETRAAVEDLDSTGTCHACKHAIDGEPCYCSECDESDRECENCPWIDNPCEFCDRGHASNAGNVFNWHWRGPQEESFISKTIDGVETAIVLRHGHREVHRGKE